MKEFKTDKKTYTPMQVIDEFAGEVEDKNLRVLVETLCRPNDAQYIEGFQERGGEITFMSIQMGFIPLDLIGDKLVQKAFILEQLAALKNILKYFKSLSAKKIRNVFDSGGNFYFDADGEFLNNSGSRDTYYGYGGSRYKKDLCGDVEEELRILEIQLMEL